MHGHRTSPCLWVPKEEVFFSSTFKSICCIVLVWGEEYNSRVSAEVVSEIYRGKLKDREVLDMSLRDYFDPQDHDGNDDDDVPEFLFKCKCFRKPDKDNIRSIISELAHQELIQKPRYVLHC